MKILIATHNPAKLNRYRNFLHSIENIELVSLQDIGITEKIDEPFETAQENAIHKATYYGDRSQLITIGIDEAMQTNFLPDNEQPSVYVRRLKKGGQEATDETVLQFWQETFDSFDTPNKKFIWDFHIVFYNPKNKNIEQCNLEVSYDVLDTFSPNITPGYPMSSFLTTGDSNKAFSDMTEAERLEFDLQDFQEFILKFETWINTTKAEA